MVPVHKISKWKKVCRQLTQYGRGSFKNKYIDVERKRIGAMPLEKFKKKRQTWKEAKALGRIGKNL